LKLYSKIYLNSGIDGEVCEPFEINNCPQDVITRDACNAMNNVNIFGEVILSRNHKYLPTCCSILLQCHDVVDPAPFTQTCHEQACRDPNAVCRIAQAYADKCRTFGRCLDWRSKSFCPNEVCRLGFDYKSCGAGCSQTCASNKKECKFPNIEGCFCPTGKVCNNMIIQTFYLMLLGVL
jgi:hypothetical protein